MAEVIYDCQFAPEPEGDAALIALVEQRAEDPNNQTSIPLKHVKATFGL